MANSFKIAINPQTASELYALGMLMADKVPHLSNDFAAGSPTPASAPAFDAK